MCLGICLHVCLVQNKHEEPEEIIRVCHSTGAEVTNGRESPDMGSGKLTLILWKSN